MTQLSDIQKAKANLKHMDVAKAVMARHILIFCNESFYEYRDGVYHRTSDDEVKKWARDIFGDFSTRTKLNEVLLTIRLDSAIKPEQMNYSEMVNVKNGMLCLDTFEMKDHDPKYYSSVQLNVKYDMDSPCEKWLKTIDEVFEGNAEKMIILQEFFGLCLTKITKFEKALFLVGEGRNGKSVILYVLEELIGRENRSSVGIEKFDNSNYTADLYGKLANISIETNVKESVYDSTFKSIVTGDSIHADEKYKKPFSFRPFCKLIIATNTLPRVDDKTDAFFERLLILRFDRQFKDQDQNKNLKHELIEELSGVFLWAVFGLKQLKSRGCFEQGDSVNNEISRYRSENNSVIMFVDEECEVVDGAMVAKALLYKEYSNWCKDNGLKPFSKIRFGKQLVTRFKGVNDTRDNGSRLWDGIRHGN